MTNSITEHPQRPSELMRDHIERGVGIPRELYLSADLFEGEIAGIFQRSWLYAGHESQLAEPGAYVTTEIGDESVVVTRTEDGDLVAFANVCRHRGARIVDDGCGVARRLVCPYHQWAYRLDGTLQGAPKMPAGFDADRYALPRVNVATWHGLVAVNLADDPDAHLDDLLAPSESIIEPFRLETARVAHTISYDVAANWKVVWENAQECYHCSANHPEFCKTFDTSPIAGAEWDADAVVRSDDFRVQSTRFPLKNDAVSLTLDGRPASGIALGSFAGDLPPYTAAVHLKPSFAVVCCPDYAVVLGEQPIDVERTRVTMSWLVDRSAEQGHDYDLDNLIKVWDHTNRQDWELCERTQLGIRSRFYSPGPLSNDETSVAGFHNAYAGMLADANL
jgi:Rieske 2Fe-2S family protein